MHTANLQAFIAVADTASFSRAAEQLFITQPAVSKRVAALEAELDARLFDRIGHNIQLTEAGHALLPRARRILAELDDSRRAIHNLSGQVSGPLSLGTSHHIGLHRLPPILREYSARFPAVELDLHFEDSEVICQSVARGNLELGIVTLPTQAVEQLELIPLWPDPLCFVCAPHHPLTASAPVPPTELAHHKAILPASSTVTRKILESAISPLGVHQIPGISTNYLETIKMMVSIGLGWSLLPRSMVDDQVAEFAVTGLSLSRTLGVVRHMERTLSNAGLKLLELLRSPPKRD